VYEDAVLYNCKNKERRNRLRRFGFVFADPVGVRVAPLGVQELPTIRGVADFSAASPVEYRQLLKLAKLTANDLCYLRPPGYLWDQ
jgi:hypothetical protein